MSIMPIILLYTILFYRSGRVSKRHINILLTRDAVLTAERASHAREKQEWEKKLEQIKLDTTEECLAIGRKQGFDSGREAGQEEAMKQVRNWLITFLREQADNLAERPLDKPN